MTAPRIPVPSPRVAALPAADSRIIVISAAGHDEGTVRAITTTVDTVTPLTVLVLEVDDGRLIRFPWHAITAIVDPPAAAHPAT